MLPLKDAYLELAGTVTNASTACAIWWELQNAENPNHERYRAVVGRYSMFFDANASAQLVTMIVLLYQAYETRKDTQNFHHIIQRISEEDPTANALVVSLQGEIRSMKQIWSKVARARSSVIAHLSNRASSDNLMQDADLSPNEIRELVRGSKNLLKQIAGYLGILGTAVIDMNPVPDTQRLMRHLDTKSRTRRAKAHVRDRSR